MPTISQLLQYILSKRYGEEVRGAIHDAIEKCYQDVNSATLREDAFQAALQAAIDHGDIPGMVIADNSVPGTKIQDGTLPLSKLAEPVQITVDSALSASSTNPVQNKVIKGAIDELNGSLENLEETVDSFDPMSADIKNALLDCFRHIARWDDPNGQRYYNNLYAALFSDDVPDSISASFNQGSAVVYDSGGLNNLRQYLTVTATKNGTTETVTNYNLSGSLTAGTCVVTVTYMSKTTTFNVTVTHDNSPNIGTGEIVQGYYFDADGNEAGTSSNRNSVLDREYYPVDPDTTYYWIQGFQGYTNKSPYGACNSYRICYYDENMNFISRETNSWYTTNFNYEEPRYYEFTTPNDCAYIRVSCNLLPFGRIAKVVPSRLYAVTMVLGYLDGSNIESIGDLFGKVSFRRGNTDITQSVMSNGEIISSDLYSFYWIIGTFNIASGGTPEKNRATSYTDRMFNQKTFILEYGDVIKFNNIKYSIRCEEIIDGTLTHSTEWITNSADYVVGV